MSIQVYTSKAYEAFQGALPVLIPAAKSAAKWGSVTAITLFAIDFFHYRERVIKLGKLPISTALASLILGTSVGVGRFTFCLSTSEGNILKPALYSLVNCLFTIAAGLEAYKNEFSASAQNRPALACVVLNAAGIAVYNRAKIANFLRN